MTVPGARSLLDAAAARAADIERVLTIGLPETLRSAAPVPHEKALAALTDHSARPATFIAAAWPSRAGPLMPVLHALHAALAPEGSALLADLVWQTAPTPELLRAFAPASGNERVRPIEGYEMQVEHSGFEILERGEIPRDAWLDGLTPEQADAVRADSRGAAKLATWLVRPANDE